MISKPIDLRGLHVALATPFAEDNKLDLAALRALVRHVTDGGVEVLVALGTTGEAPMLNDAERDQVITTCLEHAAGRPVVVGTGAPATSLACAYTARAQQLGAHGAMVVTPYYVKPTPDGIVAHFAAIADAAPGLPLVAYNVPGRTGVNMTAATVARLWTIPEVTAIKEASGDLAQIEAIAAQLPPGRLLLAGDDALTVAIIRAGGHGLVSVLANLLPAEMHRLVTAARHGQMADAHSMLDLLQPAMAAVTAEPNPIPIKAGLHLLGIGSDRMRLPLTPARPATRDRLAAVLHTLGAAT